MSDDAKENEPAQPTKKTPSEREILQGVADFHHRQIVQLEVEKAALTARLNEVDDQIAQRTKEREYMVAQLEKLPAGS